MSGTTIVNFGHPLTDAQRSQIEALAGTSIARVVDVPVQIEETQPLVGQVEALLARAGLSAVEWQTAPLLVNLPGYAPVAVTLLAYLHGLTGHFPTVLRLRPVAGSAPVVFEVVELLGLQVVRDEARRQR